uniref:Uncharacterized protein n=1 Tax=viral metagenome TaxID=1070528 RepID=A0A6C0D0S2_9ZZZZ
MTKLIVNLTLSFVRTNNKTKEKSPTCDELDNYLKGKDGNNIPRYKSYAEDLNYDDNISNIVYKKGGKLSYLITFDDNEFKINPKDYLNSLMYNSLEDGIWESMPGSAGVYPTKDGKYELGVIDYRDDLIQLFDYDKLSNSKIKIPDYSNILSESQYNRKRLREESCKVSRRSSRKASRRSRKVSGRSSRKVSRRSRKASRRSRKVSRRSSRKASRRSRKVSRRSSRKASHRSRKVSRRSSRKASHRSRKVSRRSRKASRRSRKVSRRSRKVSRRSSRKASHRSRKV